MRVIITAAALAVTGCATVPAPPDVPKQVYLQDGTLGYEITCDMLTDSYARQSAAICAAKGYNVVDVYPATYGPGKEDISCGYRPMTPEQRAAALKLLESMKPPTTCTANTNGSTTAATCN